LKRCYFYGSKIVVVLSPRHAAIALTAESASDEFKRSVFVILGVAIANVVFFIMSVTEIAARLIAPQTLCSAIKWVSVVYLIHLGLSTIFGHADPLSINSSSQK
jgi:homoserine/homoserine lactone efflux protein